MNAETEVRSFSTTNLSEASVVLAYGAPLIGVHSSRNRRSVRFEFQFEPSCAQNLIRAAWNKEELFPAFPLLDANALLRREIERNRER